MRTRFPACVMEAPDFTDENRDRLDRNRATFRSVLEVELRRANSNRGEQSQRRAWAIQARLAKLSKVEQKLCRDSATVTASFLEADECPF